MIGDEIVRLQISTGSLGAREQLDEFRETFGRSILKIEIDPLNDVPLNIEMNIRALPGFAMATGSVSPVQNRHKTELIDNDDVILVGMQAGRGELKQAGRNVFVQTGEATLTANGEPATFTAPVRTTVTNLRLTRAILEGGVVGLDSAIARVIPGHHPALRLLIGYSSLLRDQQSLETPELRQAFVTHVHDLAALALGATRDAAHTAKLRGVRAARLQAVKADIVRNLKEADLSIEAVALRHGLSRRYISQLFAEDHTTFTDFVLEKRLANAHGMLTNWRNADLKISMIAFSSGIGDLSYFNRTFRRRYGLTPSDVRQKATFSRSDGPRNGAG